MNVHHEVTVHMMTSNRCGTWIDSIWQSNNSRNITETAYRVCKHICQLYNLFSHRTHLRGRMIHKCIAALENKDCYKMDRALVLNRDNFVQLVETWARTMEDFVNNHTRSV